MTTSKTLLQLLSVIYGLTSITSLAKCTKKLSINDIDGGPLDTTSLKLILSELVKQGFVIHKQNKYQCNHTIVEKISREALKDGTFLKFAKVVQSQMPMQRNWQGIIPKSWPQAVRELRIAVYSRKENDALIAIRNCQIYYPKQLMLQNNPLSELCFHPFNPEWFSSLPQGIISAAIEIAVNLSLTDLVNIDPLMNWLIDRHENQVHHLSSKLTYILSTLLLFQANFSKVETLMGGANDYHKFMLSGWMTFLKGHNDIAIEQFELALKNHRKLTKKRKVFIDGTSGIFFILALIRRGKPDDISQAIEYINIHLRTQGSSNADIYLMLARIMQFIKGEDIPIDLMFKSSKWSDQKNALNYFFQNIFHFWISKPDVKEHYTEISEFLITLDKSNYFWIIAECNELLTQLETKTSKKHAERAMTLRESSDFVTIIDIVKQKEPWERTLDAITNIHSSSQQTTAKKQSRLAWILTIKNQKITTIVPKEQKQNANGNWSAGKQVSLKRLSDEKDSFDFLTPQDLKATSAIDYDRNYWKGHVELNIKRILPLLIDHPYLFQDDKQITRLSLTAGSPEIKISKNKKNLTLTMSPNFDDSEIALLQESELNWRVIVANPELLKLSALIGEGLSFPESAKNKIMASISSIASIADIHSDIGGGTHLAESVESDSRIYLLLSPFEEGLNIEVRTQIFGNQGPYYHPGTGGKTIIAEINGKRLQTTRDLPQELNNVQDIISQCPELSAQEMTRDAWSILEPETCLEILLELKEQQGGIVSWPEGEKLKINQTVSLSNFKMSIKKEGDWFSAKGELTLDDGEVLNMKQLMELSKSAKGRFISLADGQYIALTNTFKSRIAELHAFGEENEEGIQLHPLAAVALDDMATEVGKLKSDKAWKTYIQRYHGAMDLSPEVSTNLRAELRDYQKDGFQWLARLAHWGVGACLADDMGLGKTIQAIALLLHRANNGPALVIAPTSVAMNWMDEITRFSPTLNIIDYRESKREEVLGGAGPFDVIICSYGLLQNNIDKIAESVEWATIILDEAQAIKNAATKRSKAVMRLSSGFKVIMTGTPIENHLGELWNLFRFINPGLLGSAEKFNKRYATPIVRDEAIDVRQKLKTLIQPYILRRTKTQVLKELPARTEIELQVEMSREEAALYEAIRQEALTKFATNDSTKGHRQLEILAEITRLRRACCNPSLVLKVGAPASSKLALFATVVEELVANNHKALVFSQFVAHLTILKEKLEEMKINYQYLDGSTPVKERKNRVNAFQSGEGEIFLISLKAGGVGLNLTAADYVIHMDPWWNPAVEDQASDRAHRIGQKRPVTVYRMITKNTIEEKIVAMHHGKRDLADNLLSGTDVAGKVNMEELLGLLRDET